MSKKITKSRTVDVADKVKAVTSVTLAEAAGTCRLPYRCEFMFTVLDRGHRELRFISSDTKRDWGHWGRYVQKTKYVRAYMHDQAV